MTGVPLSSFLFFNLATASLIAGLFLYSKKCFFLHLMFAFEHHL
jgi:hypothetical protein